jgi:hypothetical protein
VDVETGSDELMPLSDEDERMSRVVYDMTHGSASLSCFALQASDEGVSAIPNRASFLAKCQITLNWN